MTDNDPILRPQELLNYRRATGTLSNFDPPHLVIFVPQKSLAAYVYRKYSVKRIKGFLGEFYLLKKFMGRVAVSTGFGIGAPVVAGLTDEFVAVGVKQFALIGMAGGLQPYLNTGSLILSTGAIRGEGVSRHYLPPSESVETSIEMIQSTAESLENQNHRFSSGLTWTTDAPFRELRKDVLIHQKNGILAVDMEAAGMLSVAKANRLPALAAFAIADTLANATWMMSKNLKPAQNGLSILFEAIISSLMPKK